MFGSRRAVPRYGHRCDGLWHNPPGGAGKERHDQSGAGGAQEGVSLAMAAERIRRAPRFRILQEDNGDRDGCLRDRRWRTEIAAVPAARGTVPYRVSDLPKFCRGTAAALGRGGSEGERATEAVPESPAKRTIRLGTVPGTMDKVQCAVYCKSPRGVSSARESAGIALQRPRVRIPYPPPLAATRGLHCAELKVFRSVASCRGGGRGPRAPASGLSGRDMGVEMVHRPGMAGSIPVQASLRFLREGLVNPGLSARPLWWCPDCGGNSGAASGQSMI